MANSISEANEINASPANGQNGTTKSINTAIGNGQNGRVASQSNGTPLQSKKAEKEAKQAHAAKGNEHLLRAWKLISKHKDSGV